MEEGLMMDTFCRETTPDQKSSERTVDFALPALLEKSKPNPPRMMGSRFLLKTTILHKIIKRPGTPCRQQEDYQQEERQQYCLCAFPCLSYQPH
jgi:hypothetical protein